MKFLVWLVELATVCHALALLPSTDTLNSLEATQYKPRPTTEPFGVRLSYTSIPGRLAVTWSTTAPLSSPPCIQGRTPTPMAACGHSTPFIEPALGSTPLHYIHRVILPALQGNVRFSYRCGNDGDGWSSWREFVSPENQSSNAPTQVLFLGDLGVSHALTVPAIVNDTRVNGTYSAVVHVGDLAYDLADLSGRRAEQFLRIIEPIASAVPYMVAPGNHEAVYNFSHYRSLFTMPQRERTENLHYSFDNGLLHIAVYNTEVFFWPEYFSPEHMDAMFRWLDNDLQAANRNRKNVPWIIVAGHRPMYCAAAAHSSGSGPCGWEAEASRRGIPSECPHDNPRACRKAMNADKTSLGWPVETLLKKHMVDIAVFGHIHCYIRHHSVYNYSFEGPERHCTTETYSNSNATVHVISGAGGNPEMRVGPGMPPRGSCADSAPWCAFQSGFGPTPAEGYDFSYSRVTAHNATHLQWQQFSTTWKAVVDEWWIVQKSHDQLC